MLVLKYFLRRTIKVLECQERRSHTIVIEMCMPRVLLKHCEDKGAEVGVVRLAGMLTNLLR